MTSKDRIVYSPGTILSPEIPMRAFFVTAGLGAIFPEWSSGRISRWLGVNPRTLQRWMADAHGHVDDAMMPEKLKNKVNAQAQRVQDTDFPADVERAFARWKKNGIDDEVIAAHVAFHYKKLVGRDID